MARYIELEFHRHHVTLIYFTAKSGSNTFLTFLKPFIEIKPSNLVYLLHLMPYLKEILVYAKFLKFYFIHPFNALLLNYNNHSQYLFPTPISIIHIHPRGPGLTLVTRLAQWISNYIYYFMFMTFKQSTKLFRYDLCVCCLQLVT